MWVIELNTKTHIFDTGLKSEREKLTQRRARNRAHVMYIFVESLFVMTFFSHFWHQMLKILSSLLFKHIIQITHTLSIVGACAIDVYGG